MANSQNSLWDQQQLCSSDASSSGCALSLHQNLSHHDINHSSSQTMSRFASSSSLPSWKSFDHDETNESREKPRKSRSSLKMFVLLSATLLCSAIIAYYYLLPIFQTRQHGSKPGTFNLEILRPSPAPGSKTKADPERWLREHTDNLLPKETLASHPSRISGRPRAALISLVRNEELEGILQSMRQLEFRWNRRYSYPWIFFNELPFSEEFKVATRNATSAPVFYHQIPKEHWSTPSFIDWDRYHDSLDYLDTISVGKGHMLSYRHMCRWNSGFFYLHPALSEYDFYWRIEPDVHFFCDIHYDVFRFMRDNELVYGFNMNILDDARSFPSLWSRTREFITKYPHLVHPESDMSWLLTDHSSSSSSSSSSTTTTKSDASTSTSEYNNCQFFSNFEIGSLDFFRSPANAAFFHHLDATGSFFYERYGDAPIHTLSVSLFAPRHRVWYFRDLGYQHDIARHCPADGVRAGRCSCAPTSLDENFYKLVPMNSPQRKPVDSCIRLWLGGEWLEKRDGWDQEVERLLGGDGYGGYLRDVL